MIERRAVNYRVRFLKEDRMDIRKNEVYDCISEWYDNGKLERISVIDRSGEDYMYSPTLFEKVKQST